MDVYNTLFQHQKSMSLSGLNFLSHIVVDGLDTLIGLLGLGAVDHTVAFLAIVEEPVDARLGVAGKNFNDFLGNHTSSH